ncbi:MAG: hypothetical protein U1E65_10900 [Myxococcota bacterium]
MNIQRASWVCALLASACTPARASLTLPDYALTAIFVLDAKGTVRSETLYSAASPRPERLEIELAESDRSIVALGIGGESATRLLAEFDTARGGALAMVHGQSCVDDRVLGTDVLRANIPADAAVWTAEVPRGAGFIASTRAAVPVLEDLSFEIPVRADRCQRSRDEGLRPWAGSDVRTLRSGVMIDHQRFDEAGAAAPHLSTFLGLRVLPDHRLLTISEAGIFLYEVGQGFQEAADHQIYLDDIPALAGPFRSFNAIDVSPLEAGATRTVLGVSTSTQGGALIEFSVGSTGLQYVRTATLTPLGLGDVRFEADGSAWIVGSGSVVLRWRPGQPVQGFTLPSEPRDLVGLLYTGDLDRPHLVLSDEGVVFLGDLNTRRLESVDLRDHEARIGLRSGAARSIGGRLDVWLGASRGSLLHRGIDSSTYQPPAIDIPVAFERCGMAVDACGHPGLAGVVTDIAVVPGATPGEDRVFPMISACNAVLELRSRDGCGRVFGLGTPPTADRGPFEWRSVAVDGDHLIVAGTFGALGVLSLQ